MDKNGKVVYRQHFDALTDKGAAKKYLEIRARESANYPDATWKPGRVTKLPDEVLGAPIDPEAMEQIIRAATSKIPDAKQAEQVRNMLCQGVADVLKGRGWAEHAIGRKGVPGHEMEDIARVLLDYKSGLNGWLTKMDAARDFSKLLGEIDARQHPRLWEYASQYVKDMLRNRDRIDRIVGKIKGVAFAWYLGANIKTAVVNATQNIVVGVPRLEMDVTSGAAMWVKASADCIVNFITGNKGRGLTADEQAMLQKLHNEGVTAAAFLEEVRGQVRGITGATLRDRFTKILGWPMKVVETFNRSSLALAAYRAAMAGKMKPEARQRYGVTGRPTQEQAIKFATDVVRDAHFVYGKSNAPEALRSGAAGRMASSGSTFRSFSHNMLAMWNWALTSQGKEGAKFTAKSLGATIALGGLTAFPFYATVSTLCQLLSGDDDDWTEEIRKKLPESNLLRDVVCYGVPAAAGVNLGGSLQMETPFTQGLRKAEDVKDFKDMGLEGLIGIPYDLAKKGINTLGNLWGGDFYGMTKELAPTFAKNIVQAWELFTEGQHTKKGTPITRPGEKEARKLTGYEMGAKMLGFQPVSSTKSYGAYAAEQRRSAVRSDAIDRVAAKILKSMRTGESRHRLEGIQEIRKWNERMEKEGKPYMTFTLKDVMKRVNRRTGPKKPSRKEIEKGKRQMAVWGV